MKKQLIKEIQASTDIDKISEDPLISSIKEILSKKDTEVVTLETQGDQVYMALRAKIDSEETNEGQIRQEGKQQAYDIKVFLENELSKNFSFTPLSINSVSTEKVTEDGKEVHYVKFGINFFYRNTGNNKLLTEKTITYTQFVTKELIKEIEEKTGKKVILENYSIAQKRLAEKILQDKDIQYLESLLNKLFLKKNSKLEDFPKFEKIHKRALSKLIQVRNNVTTEPAIEFPLGSAAAYQTVFSELKSIIEDADPVVQENNNTYKKEPINLGPTFIMENIDQEVIEDPNFEEKYDDYEEMRKNAADKDEFDRILAKYPNEGVE